MARLFITHIYPWTGLPETIVSDRGGQFISDFWDKLYKVLQIRLKLSSGHHPQTNSQTEVMNQWIAQRLQPFINHYQDDWDQWLSILNFAAAALPSESTGVSPFFVERGFEPRTSFDWSAATGPSDLDVNREQAQQMARRMEEIWSYARGGMEAAQRRQKRQADKHRRAVDFDVDDYVFVTTSDWKLDRPSRKLADQLAGPYRIMKREGNAFRLDLPDSIKVHPVFAPEKLRKAPSTPPLPGQVQDPAPPLEVNGEDEWEIDEILASRLHYRKLQYRVRWLGHDVDLAWYPARNFRNSPTLLRDFHARYPAMPGPPMRLPEWLQAAEDDVFLDDHPDDDKPRMRASGT
jgi:hypothetical protein